MNGAAIAIEEAANQDKSQSAHSWSESFDRQTWLTALCVFAGYYLGAKLGFALTLHPRPVSILWLPNSILVAVLLLTSPRHWWVFLLAALPAHWLVQLQSGVPRMMIFCWYISNCCEALIGASAVRILLGEPMRFNRLRNVGAFCLCVAVAGPFLSSFLDAGFVIWNQFGQGSYWEIWRIRLTSNVLAALTIAPLIVAWASDGRLLLHKISARRCIEGAALFVVLLGISYVVLYRAGSGESWFIPYLPLSFLLWAAVRFGPTGASTAIGTVAFLAIWSAAHGHGPFSGGSAEQNALAIQIFLIVLAVPILFLGTLIEELASGEVAVRESEARFRAVADAAPVLIWITGLDKLVTFTNRAWLEFTGRTMQQELGNGWRQVVHPDEVEESLRTYETAFEARKPFVVKYRLRRHDGEYRFVTDTGVPRYAPDGNFRGYIGACVDVTDLLEQQSALHQSEDRVALAAEAAHLGVWELNIATNELWLSDKARDLFHFQPETRVSFQQLQERVYPEDRGERQAVIRRAIETKGEYEIEYRIVLPDGAIRWIGGRGRCIAGENGQASRLLGVSMDVTERKQTEQLFQLAGEDSHFGVWDWDETTGELVWDGAMREIFDIPVEVKMTLELFYSRVYSHDLELVKQVWRHAVESGLPYQLDYRVQRLDGTIRWVHARGRGYYDDKGKPLRMIGVVFDITERKLAEEEARESREQISRLSRLSLLGEMTASIAHELNQPLTGIISNANAGQRFIDRGDVDLDNIREILADIASDSSRASDVIQHIRNTVKKGAALRAEIDLNELVTRVVHMLQPDGRARSCKVTMSLGELLPAIEGDPIEIQQVLLNLVGNAFDAMSGTPAERREVRISTRAHQDGKVQVDVRDSGPGIAEEVRGRLFDQFFTTKEEGIGMGLAIVRSVIESHGGRIAAENVVDGGARFYFTLPAAKQRLK